MGIPERQCMLGALTSLAVLMLALSWSYRHTRHSWFFQPDVVRLEARTCVGCRAVMQVTVQALHRYSRSCWLFIICVPLSSDYIDLASSPDCIPLGV